MVKNIFTGFNEDGVSNQSYPDHMGMHSSSYQSEVGILNGEYYFIAMDNDLCPDEELCSNWEVFKTDGTEEGTAMVKAIRTGDSGSNSPNILQRLTMVNYTSKDPMVRMAMNCGKQTALKKVQLWLRI